MRRDFNVINEITSSNWGIYANSSLKKVKFKTRALKKPSKNSRTTEIPRKKLKVLSNATSIKEIYVMFWNRRNLISLKKIFASNLKRMYKS